MRNHEGAEREFVHFADFNSRKINILCVKGFFALVSSISCLFFSIQKIKAMVCFVNRLAYIYRLLPLIFFIFIEIITIDLL